MASEADKKQPIFKELNADQEPEVTEIESLCLQCHKNGITKLLLTKIPFYKEVVIMSFSCDHCHWENNELQPASKIQEKGILYRLHVQNTRDLARVVVKTDWASVMIPELDFEIPSQSQEGTVTTVEGVIERAHAGLASKIDYLKEHDPESAGKMIEFLEKLLNLKTGESQFTFVLRDCSGNSFLENICAPKPDPQLEVSHFERSREECLMLGIYSLDTEDDNDEKKNDSEEKCELKDEVLGLPTNCYACNAPCVTNMKLTQIATHLYCSKNFLEDNKSAIFTLSATCLEYRAVLSSSKHSKHQSITSETKAILDVILPNGLVKRKKTRTLAQRALIQEPENAEIPHFKDVVIMSTSCDACGHKTNEVKSSSGIEPLGVKITLHIEDAEDLKRDVLKSDTCSILIKELDLEVGPAAFGSRYTTTEGILTAIKEQLKETNPFCAGDSADQSLKVKLDNFLKKIDEVINGERKVTLVLDDPCGNSYLQSICYPEPDKKLIVEKYERTVEQNEELGILDMKVENYEES